MKLAVLDTARIVVLGVVYSLMCQHLCDRGWIFIVFVASLVQNIEYNIFK